MRLPLQIFVTLFVIGLTTEYPHDESDSTVCDHERQSEDRGSRKCSKRCVSDMDCNSRKKCVCDGKCGKSCVNPNLRCYPIPANIPNGRVEIKPYNKFEAIATYTCNDGYTIVGLPARVCQGDETWMGEEPRCELKALTSDGNLECRTPPQVHHAYHNGPPGQTRFRLGTNIQYTCHDGFTQLKDSVERAWCVGAGIWVGPNITCTTSGCSTPPDIDNGYVELLGASSVGSRARYHCNKGHFLVGNAERTCLKDGSWDGRSPSCEQVVCGPPPHVEHAEHDAPKDQFRFLTGTHLMYTCQFGYYREGSERAICSGAEGQWIGPTMTCKARDCGAPGEIINGYRDPGYRFTYPTRVTYHCNEGFEMTGRPYRECQANGEWSGSLPECMPVHCPELTPPLFGTMVGSSTSFNTLTRFICNNGYKVVGSLERTCQADRTWSGQEANCVEINCGIPGPIYNGYLDGHRTTVGALYFYRCNTRTKFSGEHFSTQCMENGQWSNPPPLCLGQCQIPFIMNGTINNAREEIWVDPGTVIEPRCLNGLVLNDSRPVTCVNGTWNVIPKCVPAPCDQPPPQVENGHRKFFDLSHGSKARYFCMAGYKLVENHEFMVCEYGQWTGVRPVCEERHCPNPGVLMDGTIYKVGSNGKFLFSEYIKIIKHGERLTYECKRNYKLEGPRGATCVNGKWSPSEKPRCHRSRHTLFSKLWKPYEESSKGKMY